MYWQWHRLARPDVKRCHNVQHGGRRTERIVLAMNVVSHREGAVAPQGASCHACSGLSPCVALASLRTSSLGECRHLGGGLWHAVDPSRATFRAYVRSGVRPSAHQGQAAGALMTCWSGLRPGSERCRRASPASRAPAWSGRCGCSGQRRRRAVSPFRARMTYPTAGGTAP